MKKSRLHVCELKRHREITPPLCAVCPRIAKCRSFLIWYRQHRREYLDFVVEICNKFPDKYQMEVSFMAEKQSYVQIVDQATGQIERIAKLSEIEAMSAEEKLALSRSKDLFIVTHRLEPIVRVELKKTAIAEPAAPTPVPEPEPPAKASAPAPKAKPKKKA